MSEKFAICVNYGPLVEQRAGFNPLSVLIKHAHIDPRMHEGYKRTSEVDPTWHHLSFYARGVDEARELVEKINNLEGFCAKQVPLD